MKFVLRFQSTKLNILLENAEIHKKETSLQVKMSPFSMAMANVITVTLFIENLSPVSVFPALFVIISIINIEGAQYYRRRLFPALIMVTLELHSLTNAEYDERAVSRRIIYLDLILMTNSQIIP